MIKGTIQLDHKNYSQMSLNERDLYFTNNCEHLANLKEALLSLGGTRVIFTPQPLDPLILSKAKIIESEKFIVYPDGIPSSCHSVSFGLWKYHKMDCWTGYALSPDGYWREHSWVSRMKNDYMEVTGISRVLYAGVKLTPKQLFMIYNQDKIND